MQKNPIDFCEVDVQFRTDFDISGDRPCPVCGGKQPEPLLEVRNSPFQRRTLHLARCASCASCYFTDADPVIGYGQKAFEENYWYTYVQNGAGITAMLEPLLAIDRPRRGRLLDVGCGFGFVPHFWKEYDYGEAIGLETSSYGAMGAEKLGVQIIPKYYAKATELHLQRFDYVFSSEVIEHVEDPAAFLVEISAALADDGILVLTTPSATALTSTQPSSEVLAVLSPDFHYFVASRDGLADLLMRCGFSHIEVRDLGNRLFAWASHHPLPSIARSFTDWSIYLDYLERLSYNSDPHVAAGALYRAFKDSFNLGQFEIAERVYSRFAATAKAQYGINFDDPDTWLDWRRARHGLDHEHYPAWMGCGLYFSGMIQRHRGAPASFLVKVFRVAIEVMHYEVSVGSQFAGEPRYFLDAARQALSEATALATRVENLPDPMPAYILRHPRVLAEQDVCLIAVYAPLGHVTAATARYIDLLAESGFVVIACLAVEDPTSAVDVENLKRAQGIVVRGNGGMDFACWAALINLLPNVWDARRLVFTNDSVIALPTLFPELMERLRVETADYTGLTESYQVRHHIQSYFFMLQGDGLRNPNVREFWQHMPMLGEKREVILNYETHMLELAKSTWGLKSATLFPFGTLFPEADSALFKNINISHSYWEHLVHSGLPFVKVELLRDNPLKMNILHWPFVLSRYGVDVAEITTHLMTPRNSVNAKQKTSVNKKKSEWRIVLSELNRIRLGIRRRRKARKAYT